MIAASAFGATLVTGNLRHYNRVDGLPLEDWVRPLAASAAAEPRQDKPQPLRILHTKMTDPTFSERHGFSPQPAPITIRQDAPRDLRGLIPTFAYQCGFSPETLRSLVCAATLGAEDPNILAIEINYDIY